MIGSIGPINWPRPKYDWANMPREELQATWATLSEAYIAICEETQRFDPNIASSKAMPVARQYWACVDDLLSGYIAMLGRGMQADPPPLVLLTHLRLTAGSLASGTAPRYISDAVRQGSAAPTPRARDNIAYGLAYLLAANSGMINDPSPVRSIAAAYEVSERTVRNWARDITHYPPTRTIEIDGAYIAEVMPEQGKAYSVKSRVKNGGRKPSR